MKKTLLIATIACSLNAFAQPVILNGNYIPSVGTTRPLFSGTGVSGPGNAGANQVWDFSGITFTNTGVAWTVVSPAATPYFSSFPTSNYAWTFSAAGNTKYFYFNVSSTKFDVLADNISAPGSGNDFTPNSKTALKFPFYYGDSVQDTYQKVGGSQNSVTFSYDGYGTLITPFATYTNVWRVKEDQGGGYGTYTWENANPLQPILVYTISNNSFTLFGNSVISGIIDQNIPEISIDLYPNPAKDKLVFRLSDLPMQSNLKMKILNLVGQVIREVSINSKLTTIELDNISKGIYFYQLMDGKSNLKSGKFLVD